MPNTEMQCVRSHEPGGCDSLQNQRHGKYGVRSVGLCALQAQRTQTRRGRPATPTVGAAHRSVFQLVVGASRQRAAPRNQFTNAANDTLAPLIGYRGPRSASASESSLIPSQSTGPSKCIPIQMQVQLLRVKAFLGSVHALRPNPSLNRTFCGSPGLGFISFSPKPGLPQNAG